MKTASSYLFVPATRLDRIAKAFAAGAEAVIVDWEDAVATEHKAQARVLLAEHQQKEAALPIWVRINGAASEDYVADVAALLSLNKVCGVLLPKVECAAQITALHQICGLPVMAAIETAVGMANIAEIAQGQGLFALTYGCLDLAHELGLTIGSAGANIVFNRLRSDLVLHSAVNRLQAPLDTVFPALNDEQGLQDYIRFWQGMGFGGMLCIHPKQVVMMNTMLSPSATEMAFARQVVAEAMRQSQALFQIDGKMVDKPVILWAQKLIAQWG